MLLGESKLAQLRQGGTILWQRLQARFHKTCEVVINEFAPAKQLARQ
jgi:hypothetical protein